MNIDKFSVKLTPAQYAIARGALKAAEHVGDCALTNMRVHICDTEGAQHVINRLGMVSTENAREAISLGVLRRKIDQGVLEALKK